MLASTADCSTWRYCSVVDARGETVERDHVRALTEDGDAVDHELEGAAPLVEVAAQHHGAQAGAGDAFILRVAGREAGAEFVNRLLAVASGIPQVRLHDLERKVDMVHAGVQLRALGLLARVSGFQRDLGGHVARRGDLDLGHQVRHLGRHVALADVEVGDAGVIPGLEFHGAPDAAGHEARSPVPAELVGGLAYVSLLLGVGLLAPLIGRSHLGGGLDRRREDDRQLVGARFQVRLHVHPPLAEHVVGREHRRAVQRYF